MYVLFGPSCVAQSRSGAALTGAPSSDHAEFHWKSPSTQSRTSAIVSPLGKNHAGTKKKSVGTSARTIFQPPHMVLPNADAHWSPLNVDTNGLPPMVNVYGFVAYLLMYDAIVAASAAPACGKTDISKDQKSLTLLFSAAAALYARSTEFSCQQSLCGSQQSVQQKPEMRRTGPC
jgi:hypothetical protein